MNCSTTNAIYGPIPDELQDKGLSYYPNHTMLTHLGCVLLRVVLGIFIINSTDERMKSTLIRILFIAIVVFGMKYIYLSTENITLWKFYPRMILSYATAIYLMNNNKFDLAGMLVILDTIIAFQSRHTTSVVTCGIKKKEKHVRFAI